MPESKQESFQEVAELVTKYQSLDERGIKTFTEADTRRVFIMPLFHALGWDVYSREEVAEEVKAASGRVDYVFKLHGISQFYLEAKALRADLTRPEYVKQAITYAYNKGITWAVLSDFEGLQVYNAQTGRCVRNLSYDDYLTCFDDLWLLSKESFQNNALNERAEKEGALPPRLGIEQRLFNQLRQWREDLSNQLHQHNEHLSTGQINEVVQRLFNRLIFIRNCEDRRIEEKVLLSAVNEWRGGGRRGELFKRLQHIFHDFDGYYDSDLFAHHLTDSDEVFIEGATIEHIIDGLYEVPGGMANYDFNLIDADVLGAVYEQYLGHVAAIVKQRAKEIQARMDLGLPAEETFEITAEKQRRKEHGIYYTPKFVTNYIVKETVGRFLEERSHNEIVNIKILDPACGSGSFLIRAYDELLNYHAYQRGKPVAELDQWERLPVLTNNIFGVDLDIQAIEIARLNLLLRSLARRETLPSLTDNIRQGNSLISGTEEELKGYFGDNWREKKPFNWEQKFKDIMAQGGFDVVIGNPPWAFTKYVDWGEEVKSYIQEYYLSDGDDVKNLAKQPGKINMFAIFILRGMSLLRSGGLFGFIIPNNILRTTVYDDIRRIMLSSYSIDRIVSLGPGVFPGVTAQPIILLLRKEVARKDHDIEVIGNMLPDSIQDGINNRIRQAECLSNPSRVIDIFSNSSLRRVFNRMDSKSVKLKGLVEVLNGIATYEGKAGILDGRKNAHSKPILFGRDIARYHHSWSGKYVDYVRENLLRPRDEEIFLAPEKLIMQRIGGILVTSYDKERFYTFNSVNNIIPRKGSEYNLKYVLGILNSRLMRVYYENRFANRSNLTVNISKTFLDMIPIRRIDFSNRTEKKKHDDLVALVEKMLELNRRLAPIRDTYCNERDELLGEIERTDRDIDNFVYDLYGLSDEERKIVKAEG